MANKRSLLNPETCEVSVPFSQLRLLFTDDVQERYEIARPLILGQEHSPAARARETNKHPQTVRRYVRRFEHAGMRGLFDEREVIARSGTLPEAVRQEIIRLKTLHAPLHFREIANIIYATLGTRIDYKTVQHILHKHPIAAQKRLPFTKFHDYKEPEVKALRPPKRCRTNRPCF